MPLLVRDSMQGLLLLLLLLLLLEHVKDPAVHEVVDTCLCCAANQG
jgi:hypothetical protein